jgi:hypothetical protein
MPLNGGGVSVYLVMMLGGEITNTAFNGRKRVPPRGHIFAGLYLFDPYRQTNSSKYL